MKKMIFSSVVSLMLLSKTITEQLCLIVAIVESIVIVVA